MTTIAPLMTTIAHPIAPPTTLITPQIAPITPPMALSMTTIIIVIVDIC